MKVYISGPMTGIVAFNYPAFFATEAALVAAGHEVLNPARNPEGLTWSEYIRLDIGLLLEAEAITLLPDWETSRGARLEFQIADALELPIVDL